MKFKKIILVLIAMAILISGCSYFEDNTERVFKKVSSLEFKELIDNRDVENSEIIDLRTIDKFEESHIEGAILMDSGKDGFNKKLADLDRDKIYYIYCQVGKRSEETSDLMDRLKFHNVYVLEGGIKSLNDEINLV